MPEHLVRAQAETDPAHGCPPMERSPEELVRLGVIVLDKPKGPSSHQVAAWVRDIFGVDKAGHAGTLDPNVTGVLPIALQDASKALAKLKDEDKAYVGVIEFHEEVASKALEGALAAFTGEVEQLPPKRSAVKRQWRTRRVDRFDLLEFDGRRALVHVACQGGTYVRRLATDVAKHLGVRGHLAELRRTRSAHLGEDQAVTLHDVQDAWAEYQENEQDDWLRDVVKPVEAMLGPVPRIVLRDSAVDALCRGAPLGIPGVVEV
ncbi:MAG: RNA-guided pseudouridylation complex pseudouridine synthase subunit Cbf5, partial [Candidatus Thermoplasmatota archaeon]|nr:RNA-guided pseudouridylation complex pseudouridine synthase subunit Cbf5 [Candidatus Thermoplasmatota archaeon]